MDCLQSADHSLPFPGFKCETKVKLNLCFLDTSWPIIWKYLGMPTGSEKDRHDFLSSQTIEESKKKKKCFWDLVFRVSRDGGDHQTSIKSITPTRSHHPYFSTGPVSMATANKLIKRQSHCFFLSRCRLAECHLVSVRVWVFMCAFNSLWTAWLIFIKSF